MKEFSSVDFYKLKSELRKVSSLEEAASLNILLWYLNSGGHRSYVIISRPDKEERTLKCPDYICMDRITGKHITVEITRIYIFSDYEKTEAYKDNFSCKIAMGVEGKLPGNYLLIVPSLTLFKGLIGSDRIDKAIPRLVSAS